MYRDNHNSKVPISIWLTAFCFSTQVLRERCEWDKQAKAFLQRRRVLAGYECSLRMCKPVKSLLTLVTGKRPAVGSIYGQAPPIWKHCSFKRVVFWHFSTFQCWCTLKTDSCNANFVVTGGTAGCPYDLCWTLAVSTKLASWRLSAFSGHCASDNPAFHSFL